MSSWGRKGGGECCETLQGWVAGWQSFSQGEGKLLPLPLGEGRGEGQNKQGVCVGLRTPPFAVFDGTAPRLGRASW